MDARFFFCALCAVVGRGSVSAGRVGLSSSSYQPLQPPPLPQVGVTTIIVTHDQEEAFDLADKVVVFNRGFIEQVGSPTEIIRRPATAFVMKFVGDTNDVPASCLLVRRSK